MSFVNMHKDEDGCAGAFRVSQTGEPGSDATVDINVSYAQPGVLNDVRVCRLHRTKCDVGEVFRLGIDVRPSALNWGKHTFTPLRADTRDGRPRELVERSAEQGATCRYPPSTSSGTRGVEPSPRNQGAAHRFASI